MPDVLMCKPVSSPGYVVPESTKDRCSRCGEEVWVAPSSRVILDSNPGMQILCQVCGSKKMTNEPGGEIAELIPAQLSEIYQYLSRQ